MRKSSFDKNYLSSAGYWYPFTLSSTVRTFVHVFVIAPRRTCVDASNAQITLDGEQLTNKNESLVKGKLNIMS